MAEQADSILSLIYKRGEPLQVLDQTKLPHKHTYIQVRNCQQGWRVINSMNVRLGLIIQEICYSLHVICYMVS